MRFLLAAVLLGMGTVTARAEVAGGTGIQVSIAGDIVGNFGGTASNRLEPRELEALFYSPADYLFDGVANIAAHSEAGNIYFEVHELVFGSTKLIPRSRFRLGKFFLGVGRLNQFHRHDWPFTSAPKVQATFLAPEGINDVGFEYGILLPVPFFLDLTVGVTNGWVFGHAHNAGTKPLTPTHYSRLTTYTDVPWDGGAQIGLSYLGRKDGAGETTNLIGLDLTAKWREARYVAFLFQTELWFRKQTPRGAGSKDQLGFYVYPQYGIDDQWQAGLRLDGFTTLSLKDAGGQRQSNFDYGIVPMVTFKASEFTTVRASYDFKGALFQGQETNRERFFEIQALFLLGAHPAHDF